jgi:hypothetical protein
MRTRKAISTTAALALAAGILSVPGDTFARGGGGFGGARGPVFGFHPRIAGHRPFRPVLVHRGPARLGWQLRWWNHRFAARHRAGKSAIYPALGGGLGAPDPNDVTGTVAVPGPAVFAPPIVAPAPPERVGCFSRGYDVPGESGGVARIVVTRC